MHPLSNPSLSFHVPLCLIQILNMTKLFGKPLRVNKAAQDRNTADVGANLFIGGLSPEVDEKVRRRPFACKQPVAGSFSGPPAHASYSLPAASLLSQLPVPANPAPPLPPPPLPSPNPQLLYDTFSAFGVVVNNPKIMRDPDTGLTKGFGFISFDSFEASGAPLVWPLCTVCVCGGG